MNKSNDNTTLTLVQPNPQAAAKMNEARDAVQRSREHALATMYIEIQNMLNAAVDHGLISSAMLVTVATCGVEEEDGFEIHSDPVVAYSQEDLIKLIHGLRSTAESLQEANG